MAELSIKPELNEKLVPPHARAQLGFDLDSFIPMRHEDLRVTLD
jgi:glycogen synthase kinase 3 beta